MTSKLATRSARGHSRRRLLDTDALSEIIKGKTKPSPPKAEPPDVIDGRNACRGSELPRAVLSLSSPALAPHEKRRAHAETHRSVLEAGDLVEVPEGVRSRMAPNGHDSGQGGKRRVPVLPLLLRHHRRPVELPCGVAPGPCAHLASHEELNAPARSRVRQGASVPSGGSARSVTNGNRRPRNASGRAAAAPSAELASVAPSPSRARAQSSFSRAAGPPACAGTQAHLTPGMRSRPGRRGQAHLDHRRHSTTALDAQWPPFLSFSLQTVRTLTRQCAS